MRGKKWLLTVVCALLLVGVVCVLSNWLIDPFGVFEASPLQWDSYAQTLIRAAARCVIFPSGPANTIRL